MKIDDVQICRYLRLYGRAPGAALEERIRAMREAADEVMRPVRVWLRFEDVAIAGGAGSQSLARHLALCHAVYLVCATIGVGFDALQRRTAVVSASDAFVLQAIGAAAVEALMDDVELEIRSELREGEVLVSRYSPGYGDYPLAEQRRLLELLDAPRSVGVSLTDALVMVPTKSVSAVIGVRKEGARQ